MIKTKHIVETYNAIRLRSASDGRSVVTKESGENNNFIGGTTMITGIEIENPYRYRCYYVGHNAKYDVQNASYIAPNNEISAENVIEEIEKVETDPFVFTYYVRYQNGNWVEIAGNTVGLIVHYN